MAKEWAKKFYKGKGWLNCRAAYIADRITIDGGVCEKCKDNLGYIVHHKIILTPENINDPDVTYNHNNLEYVCKPCHDEEEGHWKAKIKKSKATKDGYRFNANGEFVKIE